jgi:hypothetical protein
VLSSSVQNDSQNDTFYQPLLNFYELPSGIITKQRGVGPKGGPVERYVASVEIVDHQGDIISVEALADEMETYIKGNGGIFQGIHSNFPAGQVLDWGFCKVAGDTALWIDVEFYQFYDSQKDFYKRTKLPWGHKEKIAGVSLGGKALERERVCDSGRCFTHIKKLEAWEISGVGEPANPLARKILPDNTLEGLGHKVVFYGKSYNDDRSAEEKVSMNAVTKRLRGPNGRFISKDDDCIDCSEDKPIVKNVCPSCESEMDKTFCKHCGSNHGDYSPEVGLKDLSKEEDEDEETEKTLYEDAQGTVVKDDAFAAIAKPSDKEEKGYEKADKPDYIDIDGDGNKTESMKDAAEDKEEKKMYVKEEDDCPTCKGECHCEDKGMYAKEDECPTCKGNCGYSEKNMCKAELAKADTFTNYPKSASNNAKKVLEWKEKYGDEVKGMTSVGWNRANQLAKREALSKETVKRMAQFNRHRQNAKVDPKYKDTPWKDNGYVAWLGWGGTSGVNWAIRTSESFKKGMEENEMSDEQKMAKPSQYPVEEDKGSEEDMTQIEELNSKIDTMMSALNIEKIADLIDEKINKSNEELLANLGKATPVAKEIVKDGKTYVLKGEHDDEDMDKEDKEDMEKEDEDEEVKKAFTAKISELEKLLKSRFADTPTSNPVAQDDNIAKGGVMKSDLLKSVESAPHLDKIEHRDTFYNVKYSNDDLEFQARIKKAHQQTGFDPSVLGMSLPSNEL